MDGGPYTVNTGPVWEDVSTPKDVRPGQHSDQPGDKDELLDAIDAQLCALNPGRKPLDQSAKAAILAAIAGAPPISDGQARRVARLLRGRSER